MTKYLVVCTEEVTVTVGIKAKSLEEAEKLARRQVNFREHTSERSFYAEECSEAEFEELNE